jgi:hypothetical protein
MLRKPMNENKKGLQMRYQSAKEDLQFAQAIYGMYRQRQAV